jgi:hypothetical protein
MKRNWIKMIKKRKNTMSESILRLLKNFPDTPIPFFQNMKDSSDDALCMRENLDIKILKAPDRLKVDIVQVGFSEIFFVEDFEQLQKGLNKLFKEFPAPVGTSNREEELNNWFEAISKAGPQSEYKILGNLSFKKNDVSAYFSGISLALYYYSPSVIILTMRGHSSGALKKRFSSLIRSSNKSELVIKKFGFSSGRISTKVTPGIRMRKQQLDEFFMEVNQAAIQILSRHLNSVLPRYGSIPMIEILETNLDFRQIPKEGNYEHLQSSKEIESSLLFLESIGYPLGSRQTVYAREKWWFLHEISRKDKRCSNYIDYQIFVSETMFSDEQTKNSSTSPTDKLRDKINAALLWTSLRQFYTHLNTRTASAKQVLESSFGTRKKGFNRRNVSRSMSAILELNDLDFKHKIIQKMLDDHCDVLEHFNAGAISRDLNEDPFKVLWVSDINSDLKRKGDSYEKQSSSLKIFYETLVSHETTLGNHELQSAANRLSCVAVLLAFLSVILQIPSLSSKSSPEQCVKQLVQYFNLLRPHIDASPKIPPVAKPKSKLLSILSPNISKT